MSNGLKTFFTELADVYRGATETTEKIVANTLPSKFEELLASGGTGGSLPEGIYYEALARLPKYHEAHRLFTWQGGLYLYVVTSTTNRTSNIYKYDNNAYTLITSITNTNICNDTNLSPGVEYNGKVYFNKSKLLVEWDGSSMNEVNSSMPYSNLDGYSELFIFNNELYYAKSDKKLYVYKINSDYTLTEVLQWGSYPYIQAFYNVGNEVYAFSGTYRKLYKFDGSNFIEHMSFNDGGPANGYAVINGKLYIGSFSGTNYGTISEIDLEQKTYKTYNLPFGFKNIVAFNNNIHITDNFKYYNHIKGYIVNG